MIKTFTLKVLLLLTLFLPSACAPMESHTASAFVQPEPETYVNLVPVVWEYFYHRKAAVLSGNMNVFYDRYPNLYSGADVELGINTEAFHVKAYQTFNLLDGDVFPEYYERIKVKETDGEVQILVHGMELYLDRDGKGAFDRTGGEFKIVLYLRMLDDAWQVYQTDEVTVQEWKGFENLNFLAYELSHTSFNFSL